MTERSQRTDALEEKQNGIEQRAPWERCAQCKKWRKLPQYVVDSIMVRSIVRTICEFAVYLSITVFGWCPVCRMLTGSIPIILGYIAAETVTNVTKMSARAKTCLTQTSTNRSCCTLMRLH